MKIAILTFHRALNYGALLQAFALKTIISQQGHDVDILDYRNPVIESAYYYPKLSQRKDIKSILKYFLQGKNEIGKRERFECFRLQYLSLSSKQYTDVDVKDSVSSYDLFVVGSDQVWNYQAHGFDENYFLRFVDDKSKKASYAASIGLSTLSESIKAKYKVLLRDYPICSVREQMGAELLKGLGISTRIDLDPSLLMTSGEWCNAFSVKKSSKKFIFAYYFELTDTLKAFVEELAEKEGCSIRYFGSAICAPFKGKCEAIKMADPVDFIESIYNAEYIVTNSFHGTAFAINFNKKFFVELLQKDEKVNSRLVNILKMTSLEGRQICCFDNITLAVQQPINWNYVNRMLKKKRAESIGYIQENFR